MVISKEHCVAGTSAPASIATRQMTIFHLTPEGGVANLTDWCVANRRKADALLPHGSCHSVKFAHVQTPSNCVNRP